MPPNDRFAWMFAEAVEALSRAERMHRRFFSLQRSPDEAPTWEPPVDVLETPAQVLVIVALPGVDPEGVSATLTPEGLVVSGRRTLPPELGRAHIHRLEIPQGAFETRIRLPQGAYSGIAPVARNGCVTFVLDKMTERR
jgi:HSP20 family molecular chaperone IbpA